MSAKKYPLGIALGGGGAKAAAHCGALQALKEFGIRPDIISGTSAGAIVAVLHASGYTPAQMIELFSGLNFFKDIITPGLPKGGFFDSKPLVEYLRKVVPYSRIEDLPVPVHIVASDMEHGMAKVFTKGELAPRVVASCSIPVVFRPMAINGVHYVDGGAFQNLPVTAIREKCEKILAFNLIHINEGKYRDNVVSVAYRTFSMMFMSTTIADARLADLCIDLDTSGCAVYDMSKLEELFFRGYNSTVRALEENGYSRQEKYPAVAFVQKKKSTKNNKKTEPSMAQKLTKNVTKRIGGLRKKAKPLPQPQENQATTEK